MNIAVLMGRLTKDPVIKQTKNGISNCSFTLAVDRRFKNEYGEREADFIPCVAWRQTAEFISRYFSKGNMILVVGSIQPRSWDGEDGKRNYITEVIVNQAYFCGGKNEVSRQVDQGVEEENSEDLPFDL